MLVKMPYDTRKINDKLGKMINKKFLNNYPLADRIMLLKSLPRLGFKAIYIEKTELHVV